MLFELLDYIQMIVTAKTSEQGKPIHLENSQSRSVFLIGINVFEQECSSTW